MKPRGPATRAVLETVATVTPNARHANATSGVAAALRGRAPARLNGPTGDAEGPLSARRRWTRADAMSGAS
jgi:hypothetical protein